MRFTIDRYSLIFFQKFFFSLLLFKFCFICLLFSPFSDALSSIVAVVGIAGSMYSGLIYAGSFFFSLSLFCHPKI